MNRNWLNFVVDTITALLALVMVLTGLMLRWVLPPGSGQRAILWGLDRHGWGDVHWWLALAIVGAALFHVALHWRWICSMVLRICRGSGAMKSRRASRLAGVAAVVMIGSATWGFVVLAQVNVTQVPSARQAAAHRVEGTETADLRGSTTLAQAAAMLEIDLPALCERIHVDPTTAPDRRLGAIARDRGMRMSDLRRLMER